MKIAIDFDGICTDLSFIREQDINEYQWLYSPFSISMSQPRNGIFELVSAFGLFVDMVIVSSRPLEDKVYIEDWLKKNQLLTFFQDILCCGDNDKSKTMEQYGITILIDDKKENLVFLSGRLKGILWEKQSWVKLLEEVFNLFISYLDVVLKAKTELILDEIEYLTDLGSSPVFILKFKNHTRLKMRICLNEGVKKRVLKFLNMTAENGYEHVSRFVASNGLAIIKTYIDGVIISSFNQSDRLRYISKAGIALAKLHAIKIDKPISDLKFNLNEKNESLLVFSADDYNTIITLENEIAFIDLEACNSGSRWVDFYWGKNLLCKNDCEIEAFSNGYYAIYQGLRPTQDETKIAELNYKLWLTHQLQSSKLAHSNDAKKMEVINTTLDQLWRI